MTEVTVNYAPEVTVELVKLYVSATNDVERKAVIAAVAKNLGKSEGSVRAKLVREGVYVKLTPVTKRVAKKAELVATLAKNLGIDEITIDSLEKGTANALIAVIGAVGRIKYEAEGEAE